MTIEASWTVGTCAVGGPPAPASATALSWSLRQHQLTPGRWERTDPPTPNHHVDARAAYESLWARRKTAQRQRLLDCLGVEFDAYSPGCEPEPGMRGCRVRVAFADHPDGLPTWQAHAAVAS